MTSSTDPVAPAERLLNLVIALVNAPGRMTKEQIREAVAGYGSAPSVEAFERMFERDKDTLRELGIPVQTVTTAAHGDDVGYRVDLDAYALPPIDLTAAELGVLSLAAEFWQDTALRSDAARALTKLRAVGQGPVGTEAVAGLAPAVHPPGDAFGPLLDAIAARRRVRFTYRAASTGAVQEREVNPWRITAARGGWYLLGFDHLREDSRLFRLSRITGRVRTVGPEGAYEVPAEVVEEGGGPGNEAGAPERLAVLALRPERAGALRARAAAVERGDAATHPGPEGFDVVTVPYRSTTRLAQEVVGYADAVLVLDPPELRDRVLGLLRVAAGLDGGQDDG